VAGREMGVVQMNEEPRHSDRYVSNNPTWLANTNFENPWHVWGRPCKDHGPEASGDDADYGGCLTSVFS